MSGYRVFEVFLQAKAGDSFEHVGQVEAPDHDTALLVAKEHFLRRDRCEAMWVVDRADVHVATWGAEVLSAGRDKRYRRSLGRDVSADILARA